MPYEILSPETTTEHIENAVISCCKCRVAVPIVNGFALFDEARPHGLVNDTDWLDTLRSSKFATNDEYTRFLREKAKRGATDLYAAFQPFNESTRAFYPFIEMAREVLEPGDIILDTWCRTGWSAALLAGLFPEQRIISIWEGDSNVLGYKGFNYWLNSDVRPANLDIIFTHPDRALPIGTGRIKLVYGLDSIHRYHQAHFLPECLRVADPQGMLIFPHIHLTNSEPDPYFSRGCHQYHGTDWKTWLDKLLANDERKGWVLPEVELFESKGAYRLNDHSDTQHYNGLILIADQANEGRTLTGQSNLPLSSSSRFVSNPLFNIDLNRANVRFDPDGLGGMSADLLRQHPCYEERLSKFARATISSEEAQFIWHAERGETLGQIADQLGASLERAESTAAALCEREWIHAVPVAKRAVELQNFYSHGRMPQTQYRGFHELWQHATAQYADRAVVHWLEDDSELFADEAQFLVQGMRSAMASEGLKPGSRIGLVSEHNPAALLVCWAAWLSGISTVLIPPGDSEAQILSLCERAKAEWLFSDANELCERFAPKAVYLGVEEPRVATNFGDWLEPFLDHEPPAYTPLPSDEMLILFTSGSTGEPKGAVMSHESMCNSATNMARTHGWQAETLLSTGPLSMMSGIRNAALSNLVSGSTILLTGTVARQLPLTGWEQAVAARVTVITAVPAWLRGLLSTAERLTPYDDLKQILVTGAPLDLTLHRKAKTVSKAQIINYYGLTETGGICLSTYKSRTKDTHSIGLPADAIVQIVNEQSEPIDTDAEGFLRVYSKQIMSGYLDNPEATHEKLRGGWLLTGDKAIRDSNSEIWLQGRSDDLMKLKNGALFNPSMVEDWIKQIPKVRDAAVVLADTNQELVAMVVGEVSAHELKTELFGKVNTTEIPSRVIHLAELPTNQNGKLDRKKLAVLLQTAQSPDKPQQS